MRLSLNSIQSKYTVPTMLRNINCFLEIFIVKLLPPGIGDVGGAVQKVKNSNITVFIFFSTPATKANSFMLGGRMSSDISYHKIKYLQSYIGSKERYVTQAISQGIVI